MAEQIVGRLFAEPHLRKYLIRKLRRGVRGTSPNALKMRHRIVSFLPLEVLIPEYIPDEVTHQRAALPLILAGMQFPDIDRDTHKQILDYVSGQFLDEFCRTVDRLKYHAAVRLSQRAAIMFFRRQYGLTEDDLPYRTSQRTYQRYEYKAGRRGPKGKPKGYRRPKSEDLEG